jgi:hypothetical protein
MSSTGSKPKSTRTLTTCMTYRDSHLALMERSSAILLTDARALSSSVDRSYSSGGYRPCSSSITSITSRTSRSISCRPWRATHSSSVRLRALSRPD